MNPPFYGLFTIERPLYAFLLLLEKLTEAYKGLRTPGVVVNLNPWL